MSELAIKDGKVSFEQFEKFVSLVDNVLVDASGNILDIDDADKAVNVQAKSSNEKKATPTKPKEISNAPKKPTAPKNNYNSKPPGKSGGKGNKPSNKNSSKPPRMK